MIKYNPDRWITLIFHRYSRKTFKKTIPNMVSIAIYSLIFTLIYEYYLKEVYDVSPVVHSLLGIVLGLFLVFRTNTAYDKWWEGRKIWGALVNDSRNLAMKLNAFLPIGNKELRKEYADLLISYVATMRDHLRDEADDKTILASEQVMNGSRHFNHKPNYVASELFKLLNENYKQKLIDGYQLLALDKEIKALSDHIGACERIKNTPIPYSYSMYIKKFIFLYSLTLPLGLVSTFHYYTLLVVVFVFYFLITIELIAEEIEEPFGYDENDLPTDELTEKIAENVREIISLA